jgi:hypothetical protein
MDHRTPTELPAVVREHVFHHQPFRLVKRHDPLIQEINGGLRQLLDVQFPKGKGTERIDDSLQINSAEAFQRADHEGVLAQ